MAETEKAMTEEERLKADRQGHRERVRAHYLRTGLDSFEDYEVLELLLFYAVPRRDTKALAKGLLRRFGSLHAVLEASLNDLEAAGLSPNAAILLNMLPQLERRSLASKTEDQTYIRSTGDAGRVLCASFRNRQDESIRLLCLNAAGKLLKNAEISSGDVNAVHFSMRKIAETAISTRAVSVILAHNHPGGSLMPSAEDIDATNSANEALKTVGVHLLDHLIIAGSDYCSLREEGYL